MKIRPYKIWLYGSLVVLFGLCGYYPAKIYWEWKHEQVVIKKMGIENYDMDDPSDSIDFDVPEHYKDLAGILPEFLEVYFERCTHLLFTETEITDDELGQTSELSELGYLGLGETKITDKGLKHLSELSQLWYLDLGETKITNEGLIHLSKLSQLQAFYLDDTQITDKGLKHLSKLSQLEEVGLAGTKITDAGITLLLSGTINPQGLSLIISKDQLSNGMIADLKKRDVRIVEYPSP